MKKREKTLLTLLVGIPIICIVLILIGAAFNVVKLVVRIIVALAIVAVLVKICITIITTYKSYVANKKIK